VKTNLRNLFAKLITGEWGEDDPGEIGVNVIRSTNFTNDGKIDYTNIVKRRILKKVINNGEEVYENDTDKINQKSLQDGDIIIEKSGGGIGAPVGRVAYFNKPDRQIYLSNNFTQVLRVDSTQAHSKYVYYYLRYLYQKGTVLKYQNQTTGIFNLKLERYLEEEIILPDVDTQNILVTQLDVIQNLIDLKTTSISLCEDLRKAIFTRLFVNNIERQRWEFNEISNYIQSARYGIADALNTESGHPVVRMNNITYQGAIDLSELKFINLTDEEFNKYELKERDLLFNRTNSIDLVGKCTVWENKRGFVYAGYLFVIRLKEEILNPYFLAAYLNSDLGKTLLKSKAKQSGNMANFSASLLGKQKILIPPIELQKQFENEIILVNKQLELLIHSKNILQNLFHAALQNAFKGEIDEELIFKELIKKLSVDDLKGNKKRLMYLLKLFEENKFDNNDDYMIAKDKLFKLILANEVEQKLQEDKITLQVK
jgi:type I restriction enzyme S subunit